MMFQRKIQHVLRPQVGSTCTQSRAGNLSSATTLQRPFLSADVEMIFSMLPSPPLCRHSLAVSSRCEDGLGRREHNEGSRLTSD